MNKQKFNKVMSSLYKQRFINGRWMSLKDKYSVFCDYDGSQWDRGGKCVDAEWCIELNYNFLLAVPVDYKFEPKRDDNDIYKEWFDLIESTLNKEVPEVEVYCLNSGDYKCIEIV